MTIRATGGGRGLGWAAIFACGLLAGCGGGGDGTLLAGPTAVVTSGNAASISGAGVTGNLAAANALSWSGGQVLPQSAGPGGGLVIRRRLFVLIQQFGRRQALSAGTNRAAPGAVMDPVTQDCAVSGTVTVSGNLASPPDLSAGDTVSVNFSQCDDGDGVVATGGLNLDLTTLSGNTAGGSFRLVAAATFSHLALADAAGTGTLDGDATLTVDTLDPTRDVTALSSHQFSLTFAGQTYQLQDYDLSDEVVLATNTYTLTVSGRLADSSRFTGTVGLDTVQPLVGTVGSYPGSGRLRISGNGSSVEVEALSATAARLHIDANGDGTAEEIRDVSWLALVADTTPVVLTSANALAVAQDGTVATGVIGNITSTISLVVASDPLYGQVNLGASGSLPATVHACQVAGTMTYSATLAGGGAYHPGDHVSATFAGCQELANFPVVTGQLDITITAFSGQLANPMDYSVSVTATATALTVTSSNTGLEATGTGTFTHTYEAHNDAGGAPVRFAQASQTAELAITSAGRSYLWQDFAASSALVFGGATPDFTLATSGTWSSSVLGGSVHVETPQVLHAALDNDPATGPSAGLQTLTGAGNSRIDIVPLSTSDARLDIDANGDNAVESSHSTTWAELSATLVP